MHFSSEQGAVGADVGNSSSQKEHPSQADFPQTFW
jgi:hypothetical protein